MQKAIFTLFLIISLIFSISFAQEKSCKKSHCLKGDVGYINVTIGTSIPFGSFADNDIKNTDAGFAKTGSKVGLNAGYNILERINLCASLIYSVNSYEYSSLTQKLKKRLSRNNLELIREKLGYIRIYDWSNVLISI